MAGIPLNRNHVETALGFEPATRDNADLTGAPQATTPQAGDNSRRIATTAFVQTVIAALIDAAPGALDTLNELAAAMGDDPNFAATVTNALATKAPLASPALSGLPTAPTAAAGTNTTQIATTAFVRAAFDALIAGAPGQLDTLNELAAALGNDPNFAATVTNALATKAPLASPALSGVPTAPSPATVNDNTNQVANTAFVQALLASIGLNGNEVSRGVADMSSAKLGSIECFNGSVADGAARDWPPLRNTIDYTVAEPDTPVWWNVFTFGANARRVQIASFGFSFFAGRTFVRVRHDATWSAWKELPSLDRVVAKEDLTYSGNNFDLNTAIQSGFYRLQTTVNGPDGLSLNYGQLIVSRGGDTILQIGSPFGDSALCFRTGSGIGGGNATWNPWRRAAATESPALTGTPTAPTAASGTNSTQIATTAFVKTALDGLVNAAPGALDTLNELAAALGNDPNFAATMTAALAARVQAVDYRYAGAGFDLNTAVRSGFYRVAEFINGPVDGMYGQLIVSQGADTIAQLLVDYDSDGFWYRGGSGTPFTWQPWRQVASREWVQSLMAPLASPVLTGSPTAPTPATNDRSTLLATTAFVGNVTALLVPKSERILISEYPSLAAADAAAQAAGRPITLGPGIYTVTETTTIMSDFLGSWTGVNIVVSAGVTLTLRGLYPTDHARQIFSGAGDVAGMRFLRLEWFGGGRGKTRAENDAAWAKLRVASRNASGFDSMGAGTTVAFYSGEYRGSVPWALEIGDYTDLRVIGAGITKAGTILNFTGDGAAYSRGLHIAYTPLGADDEYPAFRLSGLKAVNAGAGGTDCAYPILIGTPTVSRINGIGDSLVEDIRVEDGSLGVVNYRKIEFVRVVGVVNQVGRVAIDVVADGAGALCGDLTFRTLQAETPKSDDPAGGTVNRTMRLRTVGGVAGNECSITGTAFDRPVFYRGERVIEFDICDHSSISEPIFDKPQFDGTIGDNGYAAIYVKFGGANAKLTTFTMNQAWINAMTADEIIDFDGPGVVKQFKLNGVECQNLWGPLIRLRNAQGAMVVNVLAKDCGYSDTLGEHPLALLDFINCQNFVVANIVDWHESFSSLTQYNYIVSVDAACSDFAIDVGAGRPIIDYVQDLSGNQVRKRIFTPRSIYIGERDNANAGGEITLAGMGAYDDIKIQSFADQLRFFLHAGGRVKVFGGLQVTALPTAAAGLEPGTFWNDNGTVKVA